MEPLERIELSKPVWKTGVLPLNYDGMKSEAARGTACAHYWLPTLCRQSLRAWWRRQNSNLRRSACKADALAKLSYAPMFIFVLREGVAPSLRGSEPRVLLLHNPRMVYPARVELATVSLRGIYSGH